MRIVSYEKIQSLYRFEEHLDDILKAQKKAFIDFSKGNIVVPPPQQMAFHNPVGDCHVKSGFAIDGDFFVIKIATGFYENVNHGLPAGDGVMLVFSKKTGLLQAILCDQGYLTVIRTAAAACLAAQLTPFEVQNIGIIGSGQLADMTLRFLKILYPKAKLKLWARSAQKSQTLALKHNISFSNSIDECSKDANVLITTTASAEPFLLRHHIKQPIHIVAVGADGPEKQELDVSLFEGAKVMVDSKSQTFKYGEVSRALQKGIIKKDDVIELGQVLDKEAWIQADDLIITDLTGIAAQDLAIAQSALTLLNKA
jgi:ornithine cyclodeaminase